MRLRPSRLLPDFLSMDRDFGRGDEPEFHAFTKHLQHRDADAIANDEGFPRPNQGWY